MSKVLLVEPRGSHELIPVGLLKIATKVHNKGATPYLHRCNYDGYPDLSRLGHFSTAYVTSIFTWDWNHVYDAVKYAKRFADKVYLGGVYTSVLPEHAQKSGADKVVTGLVWEIEDLRPMYQLVPDCDYSVVHASRGCIRKCGFCVIPRIEGKIKEKSDIKRFVYPTHKRILVYDNNILAMKSWDDIWWQLRRIGKPVDFNQGIDSRILSNNPRIADQLMKLNLKADEHISIRFGFDNINYTKHVVNSINMLEERGLDGRRIMCLTLYNFKDTPDDFFERVRTTLSLGAVCLPMRYQHIELPEALERNSYIGKHWTKKELRLVSNFIWRYGSHGSIPPYLYEHFEKAKDFYDAFAGMLKVKRLGDFL